MYTSTVKELPMIDTCILHDDLEDFASYLGVDYDDYYQLIYQLPDEDDADVEFQLYV
jgi:hypothetical protein